MVSLTSITESRPVARPPGCGHDEYESYDMPPAPFKIALVEDNPDDVHLLERLLRPWPVEVLSFGTGQAALNHLFEPGRLLPNLILLDLMLPQMHGFDVLREIRRHKRTEALPVVIVTTSVRERDDLKYYQIGIDGFLVKPVQLVDLAPFLPGVGVGIGNSESGGARVRAA